MCCFSGRVDSVTSTNIFARSADKGRQLLAYGMTLSSKEDVAMILPLPVPEKTAEDAVRFISLQEYPDFFKDLKNTFPMVTLSTGTRNKSDVPAARSEPLKVVEVGDFEASFVPSVKDFDRLDARFRLPETAWDAMPTYRTYGFAVFKLKQGTRMIHPMAFEFPRADATRLFFPTVHIHDGKVHARAVFDHSLYCQSREGELLPLKTWRESQLPLGRTVKAEKSQGLVDGARHGYFRSIVGEYRNEDIVL